jgi:hypothetical protein
VDALIPDVNPSPFPPYLPLIFRFSLTFIAPLAAYYVALHHFNRQEDVIEEDNQDQYIWDSRLIAFGVTLGLWFVMFLPVAIWKYIVSLHICTASSTLKQTPAKGRVRANKMVDGWAKDDIRTASSYAAISTWKVIMPSVFRGGIVGLISFSLLDVGFTLVDLGSCCLLPCPTQQL